MVQSPVNSYQVPTLKNLPVKKESSAAFQYSICESIDYQTESLLNKAQQEQPQGNYYSLEQVQQLLNQQRAELSKQQVAPQPTVMVQAPPKVLQSFVAAPEPQPLPVQAVQPQVMVMTKKEFEKKFGKLNMQNATVVNAQTMKQTDIEAAPFENATMTLSQSNFMA